jgi:Ca-activated chloride channel family protein
VTPRYVPLDKLASLEGAEDAERVSMPFHLDETRAPVTVEISLDAGFPLASVESTTHAIRVEPWRPTGRPEDASPLGGGAQSAHLGDHIQTNRARVTLADGVVPADRDLELAWTPPSAPSRPPRCSPKSATAARTRW